MKLPTLALCLAAAPALYGCSADTTNYYFDGYVYDGASDKALTSYTLELGYLDKVDTASVAGDGRYFVGPLTPFNDYTVRITADGYRAFFSVNTMKLDDEQSENKNTHDDSTHPDRSQYFDAFLYATNLSTSASTITIDGGTDGTITFTPTNAGSPYATTTGGDGGTSETVGDQTWGNSSNDELPTISRSYSGGTFALSAGELTYGVTYDVSIASGKASFTGTYAAGVEGDTTFVLSVAP